MTIRIISNFYSSYLFFLHMLKTYHSITTTTYNGNDHKFHLLNSSSISFSKSFASFLRLGLFLTASLNCLPVIIAGLSFLFLSGFFSMLFTFSYFTLAARYLHAFFTHQFHLEYKICIFEYSG